MACSTASAPALVKNTWSRSPGASSATSRAASDLASLTWAGAIVAILPACFWMAATTDGWEWPMFVLTICEEKSIIRLPSPSQTWDPSARTIVIGSRAPWALHEWKTWERSSSYAVRPAASRSSLMDGSGDMGWMVIDSPDTGGGRRLRRRPADGADIRCGHST